MGPIKTAAPNGRGKDGPTAACRIWHMINSQQAIMSFALMVIVRSPREILFMGVLSSIARWPDRGCRLVGKLTNQKIVRHPL